MTLATNAFRNIEHGQTIPPGMRRTPAVRLHLWLSRRGENSEIKKPKQKESYEQSIR
jgi:hypothetical protein